MTKQTPTCTRMRVRSVRDAEIILHAVKTGMLPMVMHRLADEDRLALASGCIYVWEERSSNPLEATGQEIQRFTEGRSWGPSRARDNFLIYYEKESAARTSILHRKNVRNAPQFIKQTYSVYVDYPKNSRKWHLNAYYTQESFESLATVDDIELFKRVPPIPPNTYVCARNNGARKPPRQTAVAEPHLLPASIPALAFAPSPPSSGTSSASSSHYPSPPPISLPPTPPVPPAAPLPPGCVLADRRLAPLEYLQNISPRARDPIDDMALRQFQLGPPM
ncbi:Gti1/Pac2 family-domain-containing protein [Trametes meyenii]|nr:Gti1/Pac2 family-domain-containing protein [Trametes meyenii]